MRLIQSVLSILVGCSAVGVAKDSTATLLSKYKLAACLPFWEEPGYARYWKTTLSLRDGSQVTVRGTGFTGGNVAVSYEPSGQKYIAAKPYDYIYPMEIRIDAQNDILYVAANGLAAGIWEQTWLFVFDLREHKQVARLRIHYKDLPQKCPGPEKK